MPLPHNKVCEIEDFESPELRVVLDEIFAHEYSAFPDDLSHGIPDTKQWECAMACRALRDFGALNSDSVILGVGAGTEITSFFLANHARLVVATDRYLHSGSWADAAPTMMLARPEVFAPIPFDHNRLIVEHMDGRILRFPDSTFDAVFSSGSIEHFGGLDFVANAAFEMGRVLKPGGVLTLSTEFKLAGPPSGDGWDADTLIFSPERIQKYIVEASGLEAVDDLHTMVSDRTMKSERDLETFLRATEGPLDWDAKLAAYPNVVLVHRGYVFSSVHLVLRKSDRYPSADNSWARPSPATHAAVRRDAERLERAVLAAPRTQDESAVPTARAAHDEAELEHSLAEFDMYHSGAANSRVARRLPGPLGRLYRAYLRVRYVAPVWTAQLSLLRALTIRTSDQARRLKDLQGEVEALGGSVDATILDVAGQLQRAYETLERRLDGLESQLRELAHLDVDLHELRNTVRLFEYGAEGGRTTNPEFALTGRDLVRVIQKAEQLVPELARTSAVDISIASDRSEAAVFEACEYLGDRLAGRGYEYRTPNDAWICVDLDGSSFDAMLVENASRKIRPDGFLMLIGDSQAASVESFETLVDTRVPLTGDMPDVQVRVLQMPLEERSTRSCDPGVAREGSRPDGP